MSGEEKGEKRKERETYNAILTIKKNTPRAKDRRRCLWFPVCQRVNKRSSAGIAAALGGPAPPHLGPL